MKVKLLKELRKIAIIKQDGDNVVIFFLGSDKKVWSHYSFLTNQYMAIGDAVRTAFSMSNQVSRSREYEIRQYVQTSRSKRHATRLLYRMNHPEKYPKTDITK